MIVLGIDPGTSLTGYGIVEGNGHDISLVTYGCVRTQASMPHARRLQEIYLGISNLITNYKPDAVSIEELFFNKNVKTALTVGEARGVALLAASICGVDLIEYTPLQVKQAVAGYGRASKAQIQKMVQMLLRLDSIPSPDDAADALACAICHIHFTGPLARFVRGGKLLL